MGKNFSIVLCGLTAKDVRMVQIVLARAPSMNLKHRFSVIDHAMDQYAHLALVDMQSPYGLSELAQVQARNPKVLQISISDDGRGGDTAFKLSRRSLLLELLRVVDAAAGSLTSTVSIAAQPSVSLPRRAESAVGSNESAALLVGRDPGLSGAATAKLAPLTALLVDDSAAVRSQLETALKRIGVDATLASNAEEALTHTQHRQFDLVFLDVIMPGKDGYQVCRDIKHNPYTRSTPVLMLTSRSSPFDRARGALAGCDTYLVKPIDLKTFYGAVDKVLLRTFRDDRSQMLARGYRPVAA